MQIINRAEAKAQGLRRYFTGKPCKHGHIAARYVNDGTCVTCQATKAAAYKKANPVKNAASVGEYKQRNPERYKAWWKGWYPKNKEKHKLRQKQHYYVGPTTTKGELQWLKRAQRINKALKALLRSSNPDLSRLRKLGLDL